MSFGNVAPIDPPARRSVSSLTMLPGSISVLHSQRLANRRLEPAGPCTAHLARAKVRPAAQALSRYTARGTGSTHQRTGTIGGAMDLAAGGGEVIVLMYHTTKKSESKLVKECSYPITALGCVSKVVTNLALIEVVRGSGFVLREVAPGVSVDEVKRATSGALKVAGDVKEMQFSR